MENHRGSLLDMNPTWEGLAIEPPPLKPAFCPRKQCYTGCKYMFTNRATANSNTNTHIDINTHTYTSMYAHTCECEPLFDHTEEILATPSTRTRMGSELFVLGISVSRRDASQIHTVNVEYRYQEIVFACQ